MTLPKLVAEDTTIPYTTWDSCGNVTTHSRAIKAGSHVIIDSPVASRNPFAWGPDVDDFNPRRWLVDPQTGQRGQGCENFTGYSMGVRACIGKRMAEVEMVGLLSHWFQSYRIHAVPAYEGETRDELEKRLLKGSEELNLTPGNWPIRFEKRV
jgi:cytochrome P450